MQRGAAPFVSSQNQFIEQPVRSDVMRPVMASVVSVIRLLVSMFAAPSSEGTAAILCSAACIQHKVTKKKKKMERGQERGRRSSMTAQFSGFTFCAFTKHCRVSPLHLSLPLLPVSQLISLLDFLSSCSKFFQHRAAALGNHNKTAALLLFKSRAGFYTELKIENG